MSTPMRPAAACQRAASGNANSSSASAGGGQPAVVDELAFQLARAPARAAERDRRPARTFATGHRLEDVARGGDIEIAGDGQARIPFVLAIVQHEAAFGVHRAASQHRLRAERLVAAVDAHLLEHLAQRVFGCAVDHHAHRAFAVVLADQGDAALERRVGQRRQRDQQLVGEEVFGHAAILARDRHRARSRAGRPPKRAPASSIRSPG